MLTLNYLVVSEDISCSFPLIALANNQAERLLFDTLSIHFLSLHHLHCVNSTGTLLSSAEVR